MVISDLEHLNIESRPKASGGALAIAFANGNAAVSANRIREAFAVSLTSTFAVSFTAPSIN